jgi:retron-type reverse transcriptase
MTNDEKTKLYQQIVQNTPDAVVLERMRLHGFWPPGDGLPADPPAEASERTKLEKELTDLRLKQSTAGDPQKLLTEERKRRWEASKARRSARKQERAQAEAAARAAWAATKPTTLYHAGVGVSGGLQDTQSNVELLHHRNLPIAHTGADVAQLMGIPLAKLKWLTYHRNGATLVHYHRFEIAKKTGGVRCISAPKAALAAAQQWVLANVLLHVEVNPVAHGFVRERSIVSNALPHVQRKLVINVDVENFFPTITFRRVKGLFHKLGYSQQVATVLALLCTEPPRLPVDLRGKIYYVALGERMLPQGACTSPAITNVLCRRLDRRLVGLASKHAFAYTRYADDLTFSGDNTTVAGRLLRSVRSILTDEGFREHPRKTKLMRAARRQEVTGVTVNVRPTIARAEVRQLRAILHNAAQHGLASQNREQRPDFAAYLRGRVAFIRMVDPQRGAQLATALARALQKP